MITQSSRMSASSGRSMRRQRRRSGSVPNPVHDVACATGPRPLTIATGISKAAVGQSGPKRHLRDAGRALFGLVLLLGGIHVNVAPSISSFHGSWRRKFYPIFGCANYATPTSRRPKWNRSSSRRALQHSAGPTCSMSRSKKVCSRTPSHARNSALPNRNGAFWSCM
jgi:hypothetical protein